MVMKYTDEMVTYIAENIKGTPYKDLLNMFNERFNETITFSQLKGVLARNKLNNNRDCKFTRGGTPYNKGKKGLTRANVTSFKKGNTPNNHKPIGSERITVDGYIEVKVAEPNKWMLKHRLVWEANNGKVAKNQVVIFLDRNGLNCDLRNLKLISRSELLVMNRQGLFTDNAEITEVGTTLSKLIVTGRKISQSRKDGDTQ